jgi:hypothetical protein
MSLRRRRYAPASARAWSTLGETAGAVVAGGSGARPESEHRRTRPTRGRSRTGESMPDSASAWSAQAFECPGRKIGAATTEDGRYTIRGVGRRHRSRRHAHRLRAEADAASP